MDSELALKVVIDLLNGAAIAIHRSKLLIECWSRLLACRALQEEKLGLTYSGYLIGDRPRTERQEVQPLHDFRQGLHEWTWNACFTLSLSFYPIALLATFSATAA